MNSDLDNWDVIIIGAGAAGLMAAISAAERGKRTLVLEKNRKPGVKILMSGGTRCNITHATDNRGIVAAYGQPGKFLHSALAAFSVQDTLDFFHAEGVATKAEETGKIFPVSDKAMDVLAALLRRLERSGATFSLGEAVLNIMPSPTMSAAIGGGMTPLTPSPPAPLPLSTGGEGRGLSVETTARTLNAHRIVLTTGGQSYPGSGTTGDGYRFVQQFGHRIVPPRPALVPLTTNVPWVADLRGITMPDVSVRILEQEKSLIQRRGSLLFAHFGLSGPVILDVSRVVSGHAKPHALTLELDPLPSINESDVSDWLRDESLASGKKQLAIVLAQRLPRRLCDVLLAQAGLALDRKAAALTKDERTRLVRGIKHLRIPLTGTLGFKKAEVTAGGIALDEVDSRTMQSKLVPGLYLAGEILDLDGPIGGYNFQAAWSTGWLAGRSV
jgi:predicted flavoprotein YhiN